MDLSFDSARALYWLASNKESGFEQIPDEIFESDSREEVLDELAVYELIKIDEADSSLLTQRGRVAAKKVTGIYRSELSKFRILRWLEAAGYPGNISDLEKTQFIVDFSGNLLPREIEDATVELLNENLIHGQKMWSGKILNLSITLSGRKFLNEREVSIEIPAPETGPMINNSYVANQVNGSNNGTMNAQFQIINGGVGGVFWTGCFECLSC